jgi:NADPH2:quinone reductase
MTQPASHPDRPLRIVRYHDHGGPDVLRVEHTRPPEPGPGQVLIRAEAISANFIDVQLRQGVPVFGAPIPLPAAPGGDVAGTIVATGASPAGVRTGDRVVVGVREGAFADGVLADANQLLAIPGQLDAAAATALPGSGETALHALKAARLTPGESVVVTAAAGGVGHLALQLAKALGARPVIAAASSRAKLDFARSLGADAAVDYTRPDWPDQVMRITGGTGVDVILETVGGDVFRHSVDLLTPGGRLVAYGVAGAGPDFRPSQAKHEARSANVIQFRLWEVMHHQPDAITAGRAELVGYLQSGAVRPIVHTRLPLDAAASAHRLLESRTHLGKVVLIP